MKQVKWGIIGLGGIAAQFGLNMPSSIRGSIQWNEIYPDIISSENLLRITFALFRSKRICFAGVYEDFFGKWTF